MAEADAEGWQAALHELSRRRDRVAAGLRIARSIAEEEPVGCELQHLDGRGPGRHHGQPAAPARQHAQDVALDAEVERHHVQARRGLPAETRLAARTGQLPFGLGPLVGLGRADDAGQVEPGHARRGASTRDRVGAVACCQGLAQRQRKNAAVLCAARAQDAGQLARVDAGDRHRAFVAQVPPQSACAAEVRGARRNVAHDQPGHLHRARFDVLFVDPRIADVRIGQRDDLAAVARVGEDFLVAGHRGIEDHFTGRVAGGANRHAFETGSRRQGRAGPGLAVAAVAAAHGFSVLARAQLCSGSSSPEFKPGFSGD